PPTQQLDQRRKGGLDAKVIGDAPALERDVEVAADQGSLPGQVPQVLQRSEAAFASGTHRLEATSRVRSTRRFEYPHSLSYQPITLTRLPMTVVEGETNVTEDGKPARSREGIGSVESLR